MTTSGCGAVRKSNNRCTSPDDVAAAAAAPPAGHRPRQPWRRGAAQKARETFGVSGIPRRRTGEEDGGGWWRLMWSRSETGRRRRQPGDGRTRSEESGGGRRRPRIIFRHRRLLPIIVANMTHSIDAVVGVLKRRSSRLIVVKSVGLASPPFLSGSSCRSCYRAPTTPPSNVVGFSFYRGGEWGSIIAAWRGSCCSTICLLLLDARGTETTRQRRRADATTSSRRADHLFLFAAAAGSGFDLSRKKREGRRGHTADPHAASAGW